MGNMKLIGLKKKIYNGLLPFIEIYNNDRTRAYLRKCHENCADFIKVGFIAQMPEVWDKEAPVFEKMMQDNRFRPYLIIVEPEHKGTSTTKEFFSNKYSAEYIIDYCDKNGNEVDVGNMHFDYIFYQRPYDDFLPLKLQSENLVKQTKICYIPYAVQDYVADEAITLNDRFFRNVYIGFMDSAQSVDQLVRRYPGNVKKGCQFFVDLGYPVFEKYLHLHATYHKEDKQITWTPRWNYSKNEGGSHFLEYKDDIVTLRDLYPKFRIVIRPHPLTFVNLLKEKMISQQELDEFLERLSANKIVLDDNKMIEDTLSQTDILISDESSFLSQYILLKKPIIYCPSDVPIVDRFKRLLKGMYIANDWNQIIDNINDILNCTNDNKDVDNIIREYSYHDGAVDRILTYLVDKRTKQTHL